MRGPWRRGLRRRGSDVGCCKRRRRKRDALSRRGWCCRWRRGRGCSDALLRSYLCRHARTKGASGQGW
jgi:hypothetical protein